MKVAFLDRDGVINQEVDYLHRVEDFEYTYRCVDALRNLTDAGYRIVVVTNQAGIARGYYTEADYQRLTDWYRADLRRRGVELLHVIHCPHHPEGSVHGLSISCSCRKPKPGMLLEVIERYRVDRELSFIVGDKTSDVEAGHAAGLRTAILVESGHRLDDAVVGKYPVFSNLFHFSTSDMF